MAELAVSVKQLLFLKEWVKGFSASFHRIAPISKEWADGLTNTVALEALLYKNQTKVPDELSHIEQSLNQKG